MNAPKFEQVKRLTGEIAHLHPSRTVWVVKYGSGDPEGDYFAFRSIARVPRGRWPWTIDNRQHGQYVTLDAALAAAHVYACQKEAA